MTRFMKTLASVALTVTLAPLAANAMTATQLNQMPSKSHEAVSSPLRGTYLAAAHSGQTVVQSGPGNQKYPESVGG
jgi:hypothetical protein